MNAITDQYISIFDTAISSQNVGNDIIMEGVMDQILDIFPSYQHIRIPANEKIGITSLSILRKSTACIYGGTNALNSYMHRNWGWKFDIMDAFFVKNKITLLGVGWARYERQPNLFTKLFLHRILSKQGIHSVRDSHTEDNLRSIGINNVVNTGCPTMWELTAEKCARIPQTKSDKAIFTLTDYSRAPELDKQLIKTLLNNYKQLYFWVQGSKDLQYFNSFGDLVKGVRVIPGNIPAYNTILQNGNIDYIGTRLHGGIRAMQKGIRSIIIGIDNRAEEKRKNFSIPVVSRKDIHTLDSLINGKLETKINLPLDKIELWKSQFKS